MRACVIDVFPMFQANAGLACSLQGRRNALGKCTQVVVHAIPSMVLKVPGPCLDWTQLRMSAPQPRRAADICPVAGHSPSANPWLRCRLWRLIAV